MKLALSGRLALSVPQARQVLSVSREYKASPAKQDRRVRLDRLGRRVRRVSRDRRVLLVSRVLSDLRVRLARLGLSDLRVIQVQLRWCRVL